MERLSRGVTLRRDESGDDTFVLIHRDACGHVGRLVATLAERGLRLLDPDECEPEITADGIKVACVELSGELVG